MTIPKVQAIIFLGQNAWFPHKKYNPRCVHAASERKVIFLSVGDTKWNLDLSGSTG